MLKNLKFDINMRGYVLEYAARIMLRREKKNNFIFLTWQFDSINEMIQKYRLQTNQVRGIINYINRVGMNCDIIEFIIDNVKDRNVLKIHLYDVKTKNMEVSRDYYESCESSHVFMKEAYILGAKTFIISIILFEDWRFSFNVYDYNVQKIRVYSRFFKRKATSIAT